MKTPTTITTTTTTLLLSLFVILLTTTNADDPYRYFTWTVTYGPIYPLSIPQQAILINNQFPGPPLDVVTNDNLIVTVINLLDEPFLLTWNGIKQRKNSWQDGVAGTNCPIPPGGNYTYRMQAKDQIGTFSYFPSTAMHRAAGGFGGLNVFARPFIPVPYAAPADDFTMVVGDWYKVGHKVLRERLDKGLGMPAPDGVLINGVEKTTSFTGDQDKTYRFRISNVGLSKSINFRIQNHLMKVVEIEGSHVIQNMYENLDLHVGQSATVLVTLDQQPGDYYIVASTRFSKPEKMALGVLRYSNSNSAVSGSIPAAPAGQYHWSMQQARSFRWNLTANAARPNPQGSYHYGTIPVTKTLVLANSAPTINGKPRYAVNGVSFVVPDTPLKLADHFNITGVFASDSIPIFPNNGASVLGTPVVRSKLHDFVEIVFQNSEKSIQTWHLDGYDFWVVGYGAGTWNNGLKKHYNLVDALTRHTVQVYPNTWSAILVSMDNQGMWNLRSAIWARQYLGQQLYMQVWSPESSFANEYAIPPDALLCGRAKSLSR